MFPVECMYVVNDSAGKKLVQKGILADIALTVLHLLGLKTQKAMTEKNIIVG
jgi:bisphosphoglycerate-independent phosphoglycerate mutase (AlkP superfamily)